MEKPNLKLILMQLGNKLVQEHGFLPAAHKGYAIPNNFLDPATRSSHLIAELTEFINNHDEARQALGELGIDWPMTRQQQQQANHLRLQRIANQAHDDKGQRTPEAVKRAVQIVMEREGQNEAWASDYVSCLSVQQFVRLLESAPKGDYDGLPGSKHFSHGE